MAFNSSMFGAREDDTGKGDGRQGGPPYDPETGKGGGRCDETALAVFGNEPQPREGDTGGTGGGKCKTR